MQMKNVGSGGLSDERIDLYPFLSSSVRAGEQVPPPAVQVLEPVSWLASLEAATGGRVVVRWAIRPEVYFAATEGQPHAAGAAQD